MDARTIGTVLAALRNYQSDMERFNGVPAFLEDIATNGGTVIPLDTDEIDDLCESINSGSLREQVIVLDQGDGDGSVITEFQKIDGVPFLVWVGKDGRELAHVSVDYFDGEFQFLAYGRDQLEGWHGYASIKFDSTGRLLGASAEDLPEVPEEA